MITDKIRFYTGLGMMVLFTIVLVLMFTPIIGTSITATIDMKTEEQAEQTALLYEQSGASVVKSGTDLEVTGDLGRIIETCIADADIMYHNNEDEITDKYGYSAKQVLYNWWKSFGAMKEYFEDHNKFNTAEIFTRVNERAVEPAYNYFGIEAESVGERAAALVFSLIFYIAYTLLYGFGIMYIIEGLGLKIRQMFPFSFIARVREL